VSSVPVKVPVPELSFGGTSEDAFSSAFEIDGCGLSPDRDNRQSCCHDNGSDKSVCSFQFTSPLNHWFALRLRDIAQTAMVETALSRESQPHALQSWQFHCERVERDCPEHDRFILSLLGKRRMKQGSSDTSRADRIPRLGGDISWFHARPRLIPAIAFAIEVRLMAERLVSQMIREGVVFRLSCSRP
jgi:hypothetical protein